VLPPPKAASPRPPTSVLPSVDAEASIVIFAFEPVYPEASSVSLPAAPPLRVATPDASAFAPILIELPVLEAA